MPELAVTSWPQRTMPTGNRATTTNAPPALRRRPRIRDVPCGSFARSCFGRCNCCRASGTLKPAIAIFPLRCVADGKSHWAETASAIPVDPRALKEHVYREFVSFLPHVQRFLYGVGGSRDGSNRVFSRTDIARVRITLTSGAAPLVLDVPRVELHFFCDVDVAILAVEIEGRDLALDDVQDVMYCFGRSYPSGWTERDEAWHCPERVEWLDREGQVLATSDYEQRDNFLASVCREQVPTIAAHWKFLLAPLAARGRGGTAQLRARRAQLDPADGLSRRSRSSEPHAE